MRTALISEDEGNPETLRAPASVSTPMSRMMLPVALPEGREARPLRILLADDHPIIRQHVRALLEEEGFEVVGEASDGCEAVRLAERCRPELVILDVSMPSLNGFAAAKAILRDTPQTPVILLTMHTEPGYALRAVRAGIRGYVVKSQLPNDLLAAIHDVARGRTYQSRALSETAVPA